MIIIREEEFSPDSLINEYPVNSIERKVLGKISSSSKEYSYNSLKDLKFELTLRKSIVNAARALSRSRMAFKVFRKSLCNEQYWIRTRSGGFLSREDVKPSEAIKDIFANGYKYGTECSTAIVIVFYKAVLDVFGDSAFNSLFPTITLMNWHHVDDKMDLQAYKKSKDFLPGECIYFENPDVNPLKPEWQGENAVDLGDGTYYGHGVGIKSKEQIINVLNRLRKSGATESAYLTNFVTHPGFKYLSDLYSKREHQEMYL